MIITLDIEADNLLPQVSKIHVVVLKVFNRPDEFRVIHEPEQLRKIIPHLTEIVGHSILTYDLVVLQKLWDIPFTCDPGGNDTWDGHPIRFTDTFHLSMFLNPDRIGGHSVEAFAERFGGEQKVQNEDWSVYTPQMLERCRSDVRITEQIYKVLTKEYAERHG